jgi:hypothetical protein
MTRYFITLWYLFMSGITYPVLGVLSKRHKHSAHIIFENCIVFVTFFMSCLILVYNITMISYPQSQSEPHTCKGISGFLTVV